MTMELALILFWSGAIVVGILTGLIVAWVWEYFTR